MKALHKSVFRLIALVASLKIITALKWRHHDSVEPSLLQIAHIPNPVAVNGIDDRIRTGRAMQNALFDRAIGVGIPDQMGADKGEKPGVLFRIVGTLAQNHG